MIPPPPRSTSLKVLSLIPVPPDHHLIPQPPPTFLGFQTPLNIQPSIPHANFSLTALFRKTRLNPKTEPKRAVVKEKQVEPRDKESSFIATGHWSKEEKKHYHWFLELHHKHFLMKQLRRSEKVFQSMSVFLGTRKAEQCRSHHQKMEKKFRNFQFILLTLRTEIYGTTSTFVLATELQREGFILAEDSLMTEEELFGCLPRCKDQEKYMGSEQYVSPLVKVEEDSVKMELASESPRNFLGELYEQRLNFAMQM